MGVIKQKKRKKKQRKEDITVLINLVHVLLNTI